MSVHEHDFGKLALFLKMKTSSINMPLKEVELLYPQQAFATWDKKLPALTQCELRMRYNLFTREAAMQ